jgi:HK97 family phage major capsid protein
MTNTFSGYGELLQATFYAEIAKKHPYRITGRHAELAARLNDHQLTAGSDEHGTYSNPSGGFFVTPQLSTNLSQRTMAVSRVASRTTPLFVEGQTLEAPLLRDSDRRDGARLGGVDSRWMKETQTPPTSRMEFQQLILQPHGLVVYFYVTEKLLSNALELEQVFNSIVAEELAVKLDNAIFSGTGVGQPSPLLDDPSTIVVEKEIGQAAATLLPENVCKMVGRLYPYCEDNAVFFCSKSAQRHIYQTTALQPLLRFADPGAPKGTARATLAGYPLIPLEQSNPLGTKGDLFLADCSQYALADRGVPQKVSSTHIRFLEHESAFRVTYYADGRSTWAAPITTQHEAATQSPFITLETRA